MYHKKILKINRHLFYMGTSIINRVLRSFVPRGSTPRLRGWQVCQTESLYDEKVRSRAEMLKPDMCLQVRGYRLDSSKLNLSSHIFGVPSLF